MKRNVTVLDHCIKSKKHPVEIFYKGVPYCTECFDKVTEAEFKKQTEIRVIRTKDGNNGPN